MKINDELESYYRFMSETSKGDQRSSCNLGLMERNSQEIPDEGDLDCVDFYPPANLITSSDLEPCPCRSGCIPVTPRACLAPAPGDDEVHAIFTSSSPDMSSLTAEAQEMGPLTQGQSRRCSAFSFTGRSLSRSATSPLCIHSPQSAKAKRLSVSHVGALSTTATRSSTPIMFSVHQKMSVLGIDATIEDARADAERGCMDENVERNETGDIDSDGSQQ
ncbi:hypothetical protein J8273_0054 [Carpediemonas membranifera]|uniref:Uncharacterized protein n=1 Tax=Carpediemonas membranifera TaxID=201153 RepID=A0A8J6B8D3_9EUKA|nr:hypothetical protein J8273_0054 [Carpediemonas membranifera]|eukprot:KAG9394847.1 hypothetical protein J8273_0054 [Carpediemonas membranifera]